METNKYIYNINTIEYTTDSSVIGSFRKRISWKVAEGNTSATFLNDVAETVFAGT